MVIFIFSVNDHIDDGVKISRNVKLKTPLCDSNLPFTFQTFDHLVGVAVRHTLPNILEAGLMSLMPYVTDIDDWGHRVAYALEKVGIYTPYM